MKKLLLLSGALLLASSMIMAQPDPKEMVSRQLQRYQTELKLTPEQTPKVEAILLAQTEKMGKLFQDNSGDREAMRATMEKMREETTKKLKEVFTADQFKQYEALQAQMRANRPQ